jgi:hypothetical protein
MSPLPTHPALPPMTSPRSPRGLHKAGTPFPPASSLCVGPLAANALNTKLPPQHRTNQSAAPTPRSQRRPAPSRRPCLGPRPEAQGGPSAAACRSSAGGLLCAPDTSTSQCLYKAPTPNPATQPPTPSQHCLPRAPSGRRPCRPRLGRRRGLRLRRALLGPRAPALRSSTAHANPLRALPLPEERPPPACPARPAAEAAGAAACTGRPPGGALAPPARWPRLDLCG